MIYVSLFVHFYQPVCNVKHLKVYLSILQSNSYVDYIHQNNVNVFRNISRPVDNIRCTIHK